MINSVSPLTVNVHTIYHLQLKHYCIYNSVFEIILKLYISMKIIIFISFLLIIHFVFHSYFKYSNILNLASSFNNLSPIFCASKTDIFLINSFWFFILHISGIDSDQRKRWKSPYAVWNGFCGYRCVGNVSEVL